MDALSHVTMPEQTLDFFWLELTSRCNLRCLHCYAESSPAPLSQDVLSYSDYLHLLESAASIGCRKIQFIGGEPTLYPALPELISHARRNGYEMVEVYTNATRIAESLLSCFIQHRVNIAISFYSDDPTIHDGITKRLGSHSATIRTLRRLLDAGLRVRAAIISMEANAHRLDETIAFLHALGVKHVGVDRVRGIGRGADLVANSPASHFTELCGNCWKGSLCISPDGTASPCIMAKAWSVGSILDASLETVVSSPALREIRTRIYNEIWRPRSADNDGHAVRETPPLDTQSGPCGPYQPCHPVKGCPPNPCPPNDCSPFAGPCGPVGSPPCAPYMCTPCLVRP